MPANDLSSLMRSGPEGPARRLFAITPHATNELEFLTTGIYVGGGGDLAVVDRSSGSTVLLAAVPAGAILPIRVARVLATGTTATGLVGLA